MENLDNQEIEPAKKSRFFRQKTFISNGSSDDPIDKRQIRKKKFDIFHVNSMGEIEVNIENRLLREVVKTPTALKRARNSKSKSKILTDTPKIIKTAFETHIQPKFMEQRGSMCLTELWSISQKKRFYMDSNTEIHVVDFKRDNQQISGPYRPGKLQNDLEIYQKAEAQRKMDKILEKEREEIERKMREGASSKASQTQLPAQKNV